MVGRGCSVRLCEVQTGGDRGPSRTWMKARSVVVMPKSTDHSSKPGGRFSAGTDSAGFKLLAADEPPPFIESGRQGRSNFVIVVDHASARIPRRLGNLGLPPSELQRHIAWDIGALAVARQVAAALDAPLVAQNYSRLVIDCNRDPKVAFSIPTMSESIEIPGNIGLSGEEIAARRAEIFDPYHDHVRALLDERLAAGRPTILVAQHSMTNIFKGVRREMHAAVLYNRDRRFAGLVLGHAAPRTRPGHRRQRAVFRQRRDRLHHSPPRRGARSAACGNRNSPGPGQRGRRTGRVGAAHRRARCAMQNGPF